MPRLHLLETFGIYSICKSDTRPSVMNVPNEEGKKSVERVCKPILGSKDKPLPLKQSVRFK